MPPFAIIARRSIIPAAVATIVCLLVYVAVQQALRSAADDPQIQMAEDAARALERGDPIDKVLSGPKVEMERSLAPFLMIYDAGGHALAGSGSLHGQAAAPPAGVFAYVKEHGDERVTWQPESGVRMAAVMVQTSARPAAFVLAARSLREIQKRETYTQNVAAGALVATFVAILFLGGIGETVLADPTG